MKKFIIPLVLTAAILAIGLFLARDYLNLSDLGSRPHPRVEAHRFLEQKTPAAITYEWIPYYYRHPRPQETVEVIELLLSQSHKKVDPARMGALKHFFVPEGAVEVLEAIMAQENIPPAANAAQDHFFAAILHQHREELEKLKAASQRYSGKQLERIKAVIKETENYQAIKEISASTLESLWAEYMATGDQEIIFRMIQALAPSKSPAEPETVQAIRDSFSRHLPSYADALKGYSARLKDSGALRTTIEVMLKANQETFGEPANLHLRRANNYLKQRDYAQSLDEFEESLRYYPDYANVFTNLANMYEQEGKLPEAFAAMKKAIQIDPTDPFACYGMGRHYFMQGKYDEALAWESKALRWKPAEPMFMHAVARSYQEKGDTANAVKYFQRYLLFAPNGEHADLVKRYLASVNVPFTESTPVFATFKKKDFAGLEKQLAVILQERKTNEEGYSLLTLAYSDICENPDASHFMEKWLGDLEDWLRSNPSSHFANAALGRFYVRYAWHARGAGWGITITEEGQRLFEERLLKARDHLEKAYLLDPSDPLVPSKLISVALGLGSDYDEMEKQFQRAVQADRSEYSAYAAKLTYLMPKWGGSEEQMFAFARETVRNAPADSLAPLVLAQAHWEMYNRSENKESYFRQPEVWKEVKAVYSTLIGRFPQSRERHNWFARTANLAGDFETARKEMAIINDDWLEYVWGSYGNFARAKAEILPK